MREAGLQASYEVPETYATDPWVTLVVLNTAMLMVKCTKQQSML